MTDYKKRQREAEAKLRPRVVRHAGNKSTRRSRRRAGKLEREAGTWRWVADQKERRVDGKVEARGAKQALLEVFEGLEPGEWTVSLHGPSGQVLRRTVDKGGGA